MYQTKFHIVPFSIFFLSIKPYWHKYPGRMVALVLTTYDFYIIFVIVMDEFNFIESEEKELVKVIIMI